MLLAYAFRDTTQPGARWMISRGGLRRTRRPILPLPSDGRGRMGRRVRRNPPREIIQRAPGCVVSRNAYARSMSVQGIHTRSSISLACLLVTAPAVFADQVDMQNGDHYNGKVLSLSSDTLLLHNDNLGTIRLPRSKVAAISLGSNSVARVAAPAGAAPAALPVAPKLAGGGTALAGNNLDSSLR